jgi:hypothetical protein
MSTIFQRARVNEVYFAIGKFDGDTKRKFIHAPVDMLTLDGVMYLNTRPFKAGGGLLEVAPWVSQNEGPDEDWMSARDFFCTELNPIVMGEHELGNWQERGTDWTGLHKLGFI